MSKYFEIIVYTFGTRNYACQILKLIDPEQKILNEKKLVTRDESSGIYKELNKILNPMMMDMVVIIDDTKSVWKDYLGNLFNIVKFMYFEEKNDMDPNLKTNEKYLNRKRKDYKLLKKNSQDINLYFLMVYLRVVHSLFFHFEDKLSVKVNIKGIAILTSSLL